MAKRLNVVVKDCYHCPYLSETGDGFWCGQTGQSRYIEIELSNGPPSWCPLPDDVPLTIAATVDHVKLVPVQPFPVGTVIEMDDWLNEKESLLVRSTWEIMQYEPGMIFLKTTGKSFYPEGYTRSYGISMFLDLNPKVVEQPE